MATATETSSQQDVKKLTFSFENLAASSPGTKEPLGSISGSSDGKGYTASDDSGSYLPIPFRSEFIVPNPENYNQTAAYIRVGGENSYIDMSQYIVTGTYEGSKGKYIPTYSPFGLGSVAGEGAYSEESRPSVPCDECSKEHPTYSRCPYLPCDLCHQCHHPSYCPSVPCKICYQHLHHTSSCPYLLHFPQGATFDHLNYEIICACGNHFNVDRWVCTLCTRSIPVLKKKYCSICNSSYVQHSTYECPKDEVLAAEFKSVRDYRLSVGAKVIPTDKGSL